MKIFFGAARIVAVLVGLLLGAPAVTAGGFQVSPVLARIQPGQQVATFTLGNAGSQPVTVQVDVMDWRQDTDGDHFVPSVSVVVAPRVLTLPPGEDRLVRVALRSKPVGEVAFRVHFREVPPPAQPGFVGVRTLVSQNVPLMFLAAGAAAPQWKVILSGGQLTLSASNAGERYFRSGAIEVADDRGAILARRDGSLHLLSGSTGRWPLLTHARISRGDTVRLRFPADPELAEISLIVE